MTIETRVDLDKDALLRRAQKQLADYDQKFRQLTDEHHRRVHAMSHVRAAMDEAIGLATRVDRFREARHDDQKWASLEQTLAKFAVYFRDCMGRFDRAAEGYPQELAERVRDENSRNHAGEGDKQGGGGEERKDDSAKAPDTLDGRGSAEKQET